MDLLLGALAWLDKGQWGSPNLAASHQSSARLRNSEAGGDWGAQSNGAGPLWHATEDKPTSRHSGFEWQSSGTESTAWWMAWGLGSF